MSNRKGTKQVMVNLDEAYAKEFHMRCIEYEVTMSSVLKTAIDDFMGTHHKVTKRTGDIV